MYTKIFIIFESIHNLICKIKYKAKIAQTEKRKSHCAADGLESGPRAGPLPLGPRGHRARALPLTRPLTGRSRPSEASSSSRHRSGELRLRAGEPSASAVGRASFSNSTRTPYGVQGTGYSLLLSCPRPWRTVRPTARAPATASG